MSETPTPAGRAPFPERVAARAEQVQVVRLLLSLVAIPFYVVGIVVGVIWLVLRWAYAAVVVGYQDAVNRSNPREAPE